LSVAASTDGGEVPADCLSDDRQLGDEHESCNGLADRHRHRRCLGFATPLFALGHRDRIWARVSGVSAWVTEVVDSRPVTDLRPRKPVLRTAAERQPEISGSVCLRSEELLIEITFRYGYPRLE
jgi:hypothetical protein